MTSILHEAWTLWHNGEPADPIQTWFLERGFEAGWALHALGCQAAFAVHTAGTLLVAGVDLAPVWTKLFRLVGGAALADPLRVGQTALFLLLNLSLVPVDAFLVVVLVPQGYGELVDARQGSHLGINLDPDDGDTALRQLVAAGLGILEKLPAELGINVGSNIFKALGVVILLV